MSGEELTEETYRLLDEICKREGFAAYKTTITSGSCKGDGYASKLYRLMVNGTTESGENRTLQLIIKTAPPGEKHRKSFDCQSLFKREIYMYEKIFPEFDKLQQELNVPSSVRFQGFCKYYGGSAKNLEEVVVLENLKECGYEMWNRKNPMNYDVIKSVVQTYGRFHALSFALRDKKPEIFKELSEGCPDILVPIMVAQNNQSLITNNLEPARACLDPVKDAAALERYDKFVKKSWSVCERIVKEASAERYAAFGQGDSWCNNMMFKFQKPGSPKEIMLLDWQIARFISPVLDLAYFILPFLNQIPNGVDELLEVYYKSFSTFLRQLGCDPEKLYPNEVLKSHWKQFCVQGLLWGCILGKVMLIDDEDVPEFAGEDDKDITDAFCGIRSKDDEYHEIMRKIIYYCIEQDCI